MPVDIRVGIFQMFGAEILHALNAGIVSLAQDGFAMQEDKIPEGRPFGDTGDEKPMFGRHIVAHLS